MKRSYFKQFIADANSPKDDTVSIIRKKLPSVSWPKPSGDPMLNVSLPKP